MIPRPNDAGRLQASFRRLVTLVALAILLVLAALIWREYRLQIASELDLRRSSLQEHAVAVEAIVTAADVHVSSLRSAMERELSSDQSTRLVNLPTLDLTVSVPIELLGKPAESEAHRSGTLVGVPAHLASRPESAKEFEAIFSLYPQMAAVQSAQRFFRWSYFFSAGHDLLAIYPYAPIENFLGGEDQTAALAGFYDYDVYKLTIPSENPSRKATWTPVYFDAGGAGLMVSHNAPVDIEGKQRGMVGTDILLGVLSDRLVSPEEAGALSVIVDQSGNVVADSNRVAASAKDVTKASALIPSPLETIPGGDFARTGANYAMYQPVGGTPWRLYYLVPATHIETAAVQKVLPYLAFLVVLGLTMSVGYLLISRGYLQPAFQLAANLERRAAGEPVESQEIASGWRPWFDRVQDIFESRELTLRQLRQAEEKSAAIISVALDAVVTTDKDGRVVDFNPAAERMFGRSHEEAIGKAIGELIVPPHLKDAHQAGMERHARTGQTHVLGQRLELDALHASGRVFPVEIQIHQLKDLANVRYAAYIHDLSEQKASAAALQDQREKLYQAEKLTAMGSLLAGLAHELNNPLAVVIAQTSLLEEVATDVPTQTRATKIRVAAERCGRIVRTFLSMARKQTPQRSNVDLRLMVQQALDVLAYGLRSSGVDIVQDHSANLPEIEADPDQLNQVIINLLVNAQQAFGDRAGERIVTIRTSVPDASHVALTIADNGPGIPEAVMSRIFEAFFTTKPVGVGTGIGLAVCRSIIEAHGGQIIASNRPEGGALFEILLPAKAALAGKLAAPAQVIAEPADRLQRRLLIVDDEPEVADSLAGYLELDDHDVSMVHAIADALDILTREKFDMVFCDLRMPGGGGTSLWNEVAKRDAGLADRFVFVTGDMVAGPETLRLASGGRPVRILEKPFDRDDIRKALASVFGPSLPGN